MNHPVAGEREKWFMSAFKEMCIPPWIPKSRFQPFKIQWLSFELELCLVKKLFFICTDVRCWNPNISEPFSWPEFIRAGTGREDAKAAVGAAENSCCLKLLQSYQDSHNDTNYIRRRGQHITVMHTHTRWHTRIATYTYTHQVHVF